MIHCEETLLKSVISDIRKYTEGHPDDASFFRDIEELGRLSLQRVTLKNDLEFFDEINKIFNIITTIINHPHILNARETIIVRAEQAHGITPEMFLDTVRDQKLWKDKNGVMTPAEVYYFQNVDELANYENRFIVHLLDTLSRQLGEYQKFYDFIVGTLIQGNRLTQESSTLERAYERIESLTKKMRRIKNTEFYRIVSKANTNFTSVEATNIFKHNRAYGACYKFYLKDITYRDDDARANDMATYYFTRLLVALSAAGFIIVGGANKRVGTPFIHAMVFQSEEFTISLTGAQQYGGIFVTVAPRTLGHSYAARNLLLFDSTIDFEDVKKNLWKLENLDATTVDAVTLWDAAYVENGKIRSLNRGGISENVLMQNYLAEKTRMLKASRRIYETHCPACGAKDITGLGDDKFHCSACNTDYMFVDENIWFSKLRRL